MSLPPPGPTDVVVRTVRSGISRGTETLVFRGGVPASQYAAMRAPFQEGDFPGPVKYGYLNVGVVEHGPPELRGRTVFCLYPHQTAYVVPARSVVVVPEGRARRSRRARRHRGDRRQRLVGRRAARRRSGHRRRRWHGGLLRRAAARAHPGHSGDPRRRRRPAAPTSPRRSASTSPYRLTQPVVATSWCTPAPRRPDCSSRLDLLAPEGTVIDLSWYGDADVTLSLGGAFHSRRLGIRASQVGVVAPARRETRTTSDRLATRPRSAGRSRLRYAPHRSLTASTSCPR